MPRYSSGFIVPSTQSNLHTGSREIEEHKLTGNVESYMHPSTVCQFLDPLNRVVECMPWVHLVSPVLVHSDESIEVRNLTFLMSHKGGFETVG